MRLGAVQRMERIIFICHTKYTRTYQQYKLKEKPMLIKAGKNVT